MKVTLKALRVNAGYNLAEASEKLGITTRTLINWENNKTYPDAHQLLQICSAYQCDLNDIFLPDKLA